MAAAEALIQHPKVRITDIEAQLGLRYTAETLEALRALYPGVRFVWLMGADNLAEFHRWQDWTGIAQTVPLGVIARPWQRIAARNAPAARRFRHARLPGHRSQLLARASAPAWCLINAPMLDVSSSQLRAAGQWPDVTGN